ncbi:nucleoside triphosphate pyrophosphatase [Magnetospirillum sp. UT-4]|uniref:Maf family protein n=1 Tax=Magnetospirillum sp. UT-4 TaxID=2681467 RepID=UPI00137F2184|nr:nucleoside triphosphate pyrophosphatase [Magnetospirillum sp. UT-4]CAA7621939.1 conserved hypothetical protein [Magnetospirillum sp. UT-4]
MMVLASASAARRQMLERAGVAFTVDTAAIDEAAMKESLKAEGADCARVAGALAELKAQRVSARHPGALVVGADQMLDCHGQWFDKPADRAAARAQLVSLRGRSHTLVSAVVAVRDGMAVWHAVDRAAMTMRAFTDSFLDSYLDQAGPEVLGCVGVYQVEGLGAQLFSRIEGDHSTIMGMPLLPLLGYLRDCGELPA